MNKKVFVTVTFLLTVGLLFAAGCGSQSGRDKNAVIPVSTIQVGANDGTIVSGKLEAIDSANVVSKISGKVARIPVDIGAKVSSGDLLVALDAPELLAAVQLAEANLQKARNSDLSSAENQAQSNLASTEAAYRNKEAEYTRFSQLLNEGAISRQNFDQVEKDYLQAKTDYESAARSLQIVKGSTVPDTIRVCEAQLAQARANYNNSRITAPISGIITAKNVNTGELASPNLPLVSIVDLDKVVVRANVSEKLINSLHAGQVVQVKVSAVSDEPFEGEITNISDAADTVTKAYPVKIQINNAGHRLKPGMFAEVTLAGDQDKMLSIPREAVLNKDDKSYVFVVESNKAMRKIVETGRTVGSSIMIRSGLEVGDVLITTVPDNLQDGMKVTVINK